MTFDHPTEDLRMNEPDRSIWEEDNPVTSWMDSTDLEEILYSLLYGDPQKAKTELDAAIEARFHQWLEAQSQQDEEDMAADRYADRWAA